MITLRDSSGSSAIGKIAFRDSSGLSTIATVQLRDANGLSTVYSATGSSTGQLTPDEVYGYGYSKTSIAISTTEATVDAPSGATIAWNFTGSGWSATSPGNATSAFRKITAPGNSETTTVTATVTVGGVSKTSNAITAYTENTYVG